MKFYFHDAFMTAIISITGRSGSGKTTLIEGLIGHFSEKGLKISIIKHLRHEFQMDHPGKDTWRYREAGAGGAAIMNESEFAVTGRHGGTLDPRTLAERFFPDADLVIIEGDRESAIDKIEVIGDSAEQPLYRSGIANIIALASDREIPSVLPLFKRDDVAGIGQFIEKKLFPGG
ncbi:MAG TPA: molybdopterin-guanine dinucleotide biosynthesis protein B [Spirochaetes bacterium]|nr:molybdopterin-guanine dinucleotide biosynthesis protein B [Spirochaetota bacterium]